MSAPNPQNVHGTALVIGAHGILIRGRSGAGKSLLALDLLEAALSRSMTAFLVADDRVDIRRVGADIVMSPPETLAGQIELRGRGIVGFPFVRRATLALIVDLVAQSERMPEQDAFVTRLLAVELPACPVPARGVTDPVHQRLLVMAALRALG